MTEFRGVTGAEIRRLSPPGCKMPARTCRQLAEFTRSSKLTCGPTSRQRLSTPSTSRPACVPCTPSIGWATRASSARGSKRPVCFGRCSCRCLGLAPSSKGRFWGAVSLRHQRHARAAAAGGVGLAQAALFERASSEHGPRVGRAARPPVSVRHPSTRRMDCRAWCRGGAGVTACARTMVLTLLQLIAVGGLDRF